MFAGEASIKDGHGGVFELMVDYGDGFEGRRFCEVSMVIGRGLIYGVRCRWRGMVHGLVSWKAWWRPVSAMVAGKVG